MIALSVAVLVAMFVAAALLPVNLGLIGLAGAFIVGVAAAGLPARDIVAGFPADLFVTLVGITYLFSLARRNGTIGLIVNWAVRATGGRSSLLPPLIFVLAGLMSGLGAPGPAAVAIVAPVALTFARDHGLSPLLMGLMAIHGTQAGAFSPISVYGGITNQVLTRAGMTPEPTSLFLASLAFNGAIGLGAYVLLHRRQGKRTDEVREEIAPEAAATVSRDQVYTLIGLAVLAIGALAFRLDIGFLAICVIVMLAILSPRAHKGGFEGIDWSTVVLITGIVTYVGMMERIGTIDALTTAIGHIGLPLATALLLCSIAGVTSAFASSTALLGVVIPLAAPLIGQPGISAMPLIAAVAVSLTIVDTSPFSTNGALVVANDAPDDKQSLFRKLLLYTAGMVIAGPVIAWAVLVLTIGGLGG